MYITKPVRESNGENNNNYYFITSTHTLTLKSPYLFPWTQSNNIMNVQYNDILKVLSLKSEEGSMISCTCRTGRKVTMYYALLHSVKEITCIQKSTS